MIKSFFVSCLILLCLCLLESAVLSNLFFLPCVPDLLLLAVLYFSVHNGRLLGCSTGFVAGLFLDFLSSCPLGLNCLLFTISGYILGFFSKRLNTESVFLQIVAGFLSTMLKVGILWVISILYPAPVTAYNIFSFVFLWELVLNIVLCPVLFAILKKFDSIIVLNPEAVN